MQRPDLVSLDKKKFEGVWRLFRSHPTVGCCMQAIQNFLFSSDFEFPQGMPLITQRMFKKSAFSALEWVICIGVVPVTFKILPGYDNFVPVVPVPESVDIFVRVTPTGEKVYEAVFKKSSNVMGGMTPAGFTVGGDAQNTSTRVFVWHGTKHPPTSTGDIITPITHLQTSEEFVNFLKYRTCIAEHIRSNPPIVTQSRAKRNNDAEGVVWGVDEDTLRFAEKERIDGLENSARIQQSMHAEWCNSVVPRDPVANAEFQEACRPHEYYVTQERDTSNTQLPLPTADLAAHIRWSEEKIYQIFGIPYSMFTNTGSSLQTNYMQELALNQTMSGYRSIVEGFLNDSQRLAELLTKTNEAKQAVHEFDNNTGMHSDEPGTTKPADYDKVLVEADKPGEYLQMPTFETVKESKSRNAATANNEIRIVMTPCVSSSDVCNLYKSGLIADEEARDLLRSTLNLPSSVKGKLVQDIANQPGQGVPAKTATNSAAPPAIAANGGKAKGATVTNPKKKSNTPEAKSDKPEAKNDKPENDTANSKKTKAGEKENTTTKDKEDKAGIKDSKSDKGSKTKERKSVPKDTTSVSSNSSTDSGNSSSSASSDTSSSDSDTDANGGKRRQGKKADRTSTKKRKK